jgi:hypothetical protein
MNISSRRSRDQQELITSRAIWPQTLFARQTLVARPGQGLVFSLCAAAFAALAPEVAFAQGRLEAQYEATLAGIPVGKGAWTIEIGDDTFSASAQGGTAGLLKAFSGGKGSGASQGRVVSGALVPNAYTATTTTQKKSETIRLVLANGGVKDFSIDPAPPVDPDRVVVTDAHRKGVLDPMTGSMLRVPGNGEVLSPDSCRTGTGIFDGRMRYDLKLDYKRMETVKAERGYHGPALVCAIYFTPVAGYIPDRPVIKYLATERRIEIAFVPIAGTRILVPFRMTIPTPFGPAMLEATSFVTTAAPPRVAKTN